ncbi:methyltransferase [Aurantiacibacter sp. MUD11]|uniref:methyltransferase domain-containing protein n=1 Tax=Aurantiacibacter sp. MUD11 TaxID=3003265 RepID=UPI0022AAE162|nr:methyltransferase domain-containing protein [Aurantiacibacter sp. MUD11]WAT18396.1 methyltransferase [Aurantiacibacter sp. MUD11]
MATAPPAIFSPVRKQARYDRARRLGGDHFLFETMIEDILERLAFVRHTSKTAALQGLGSKALAEAVGCEATFLAGDFDTPVAATSQSFDLVASIGSLDTVNDLPGALIQMRELLTPEGLAIASFVGGASLGKLRRAMIDAEPDRPAARMHPLVDPRSAPALLGRAGWRDPVVDSFVLTVRYGSLDRLVQDLRAHGLGSALAKPAPPLGRDALQRARAAFLAQADEDGKVSETFEIITLTGRR